MQTVYDIIYIYIELYDVFVVCKPIAIIHAYIQVFMRVCAQTCTQFCICICTCVYIYTHSCILIYIYIIQLYIYMGIGRERERERYLQRQSGRVGLGRHALHALKKGYQSSRLRWDTCVGIHRSQYTHMNTNTYRCMFHILLCT